MRRTDFSTTTREDLAGDLTFTLLGGAPGGGRSTKRLGDTIAVHAPQIIVVSRIDLLRQHVARLREIGSKPDGQVKNRFSDMIRTET